MFQKPTDVKEVTRGKFISMMVAAGKTADQAEMQAKVCVGLGSAVKIGRKFVSIKKEKAK